MSIIECINDQVNSYWDAITTREQQWKPSKCDDRPYECVSICINLSMEHLNEFKTMSDDNEKTITMIIENVFKEFKNKCTTQSVYKYKVNCQFTSLDESEESGEFLSMGFCIFRE